VSFPVGRRLGRYELASPLGAGGMGEVYRARDTRLGREVAIKVLPESFARDQGRLRRFEQEARAVAALNHPNILAVHDVGTYEGMPYIVSELLDGQTLRERLADGPVPPRKAVELLVQVADGLAAAHEKGVVHRDLKPENIFITRDARVKILDFGLAKLARTEVGVPAGAGATATVMRQTTPGVVLGTAGYMSPEQVRGREVDGRSDIFSFGAIAYEMISGKPAFGNESSVETMNAILKEEPSELDTERLHVSPGLEKIIRHCLEKEPAHRFQSARDLAFALSALSHPSGSSAVATVSRRSIRARMRDWLTHAAVALLAGVAAVALTLALQRGKRLDFQQLTFRRGNVVNARFAPDSKTVLYSAQWDGKPAEVFSAVADSPESRPLGLGNADLLAVSSTGELAVLLKPVVLMDGFAREGTLARVPIIAGTTPRAIAENIVAADWSPDGKNLAVVRRTATDFTLEYPIGKPIYHSTPQGWLGQVRISRSGDAIALLDHPQFENDRGKVVVTDTEGKVKHSSEMFPGAQGLVWAPTGDVWFTAVSRSIPSVATRALMSLTDSGSRFLLIAPGEMTIHDVSADGLALITVQNRTRTITVWVAGTEKDLGWLDRSFFQQLSNDGTMIVFSEVGKAGGAGGLTYLRNLDGATAMKLSEGYAIGMSGDNKWVAVGLQTDPPQYRLVPTGAGETRTIQFPQTEQATFVGFSADNRHLLFNRVNAERKQQTFQSDLDGANLRPYTSAGTVVVRVAPDGCCELHADAEAMQVRRIGSDNVEPIRGLTVNEQVAGASNDLDVLYVVSRIGFQVKLWKLDRHSGARQQIAELAPHDATGVVAINNVGVSADGKTIVYGYTRETSDLYLAKPAK